MPELSDLDALRAGQYVRCSRCGRWVGPGAGLAALCAGDRRRGAGAGLGAARGLGPPGHPGGLGGGDIAGPRRLPGAAGSGTVASRGRGKPAEPAQRGPWAGDDLRRQDAAIERGPDYRPGPRAGRGCYPPRVARRPTRTIHQGQERSKRDGVYESRAVYATEPSPVR
jgi:hypothetical protein